MTFTCQLVPISSIHLATASLLLNEIASLLLVTLSICQAALTFCWYLLIFLSGERHSGKFSTQEHNSAILAWLEPRPLDPESKTLTIGSSIENRCIFRYTVQFQLNLYLWKLGLNTWNLNSIQFKGPLQSHVTWCCQSQNGCLEWQGRMKLGYNHFLWLSRSNDGFLQRSYSIWQRAWRNELPVITSSLKLSTYSGLIFTQPLPIIKRKTRLNFKCQKYICTFK